MRRPILWWGAGAAVLLVAAFLVFRPRAEATAGADLGDPLWVSILSPRPGFPTTVGLPVEIQVTAFGANPLTGLELWADGILAEAWYPPGDSPTQHLPMRFVWIPQAEGPHLLVARALDAKQGSAESNAVKLIAGPRPLTEEVKAGLGEDEESFAIGGGGQGPSGAPGPAEPLPQPPPMPSDDETAPAVLWEGSWISGWINSLADQEPPVAPEITGEAEGCAVSLAIHDLSDNEDGFRLYRKLPGAKKWMLIAELAGQSEAEYVAYSIESSPAPAWYRAEAFNGKGQAVSLPQWIAVSPQDCAGGQPEQPVGELKLVDLSSNVSADHAYCYASIGGMHWQRLPAFGFFPAKPGGFEVDQVIADLNLAGLDGQPAAPNQPLDLECWGWVGATVQQLGQLHLDVDPGSQGNFEITSDLMSALVEIMPVYKPLSGDGDFPSPEDFGVGGDPNMPYTFALVTDNVENCKSHTPSEGSNLVENLLFCTPYPEFTDGSQPYLTWWLIEGACMAGKGDACYGLDELQQAIDEQGGKFSYTVYDCDKTGLCYVHTFPLNLTAFVIPPFTTCGEPRYFVAQFNVYLGPGDYPSLSGPGSPPFAYSIPCPEAYETEGFVLLDVGFESLTIGHADDDDGGQEDLEVFGYFRAQTSSGDDSRQLNLGLWGYSSADCPGNETFSGSLPTAGASPDCPTAVDDGTFALSDFRLCQTEAPYSCYLWPENAATDYALNNNHFQLRVLEGNAIVVEALLVDYDSGSANDTACHVVFSTPNWPLETWSGFSGGEFSGSQGDNGNASCVVKVTFTAVGP